MGESGRWRLVTVPNDALSTDSRILVPETDTRSMMPGRSGTGVMAERWGEIGRVQTRVGGEVLVQGVGRVVLTCGCGCGCSDETELAHGLSSSSRAAQ